MTDEQATIICTRVADGRAEDIAVGSTTTFCHDCGAQVWIAPSSVNLITRKPQTSVRCLPCTLARMKASPKEEFDLRVLPETLEEVAEHFKITKASKNDGGRDEQR